MYYAYIDYQHNLLALTDAAGKPYERYSYDPWGNRVEASDWNVESDASDLRRIGVNRGYTMHEYLPEFGLINMNGRPGLPLLAMENAFSTQYLILSGCMTVSADLTILFRADIISNS